MDHDELLKEMEMDYYELAEYLKKKHGAAKYDYFCNETCRSKNKKAVRTSEGLFCHHIDEDKANNLGNSAFASKQPYEYQKAERLLYCNYLEHLLLHIQIGRIKYWKEHKELNSPDQLKTFIVPGVHYLCEEINDMYKMNGSTIQWKKRCFEEIKNNFEDYICILKSFVNYLSERYTGDKTQITQSLYIGQRVEERPYGRCIVKEDGNGIIKDIVEKDTDIRIIVEFADEEREIPMTEIERMGYDDALLQVKKTLSLSWEKEVIDSIFKCLT